MTGHVAPGVTLDQVKQRLSTVKGTLVECPLVSDIHFCSKLRSDPMPQEFLVEDDDLISTINLVINEAIPVYL